MQHCLHMHSNFMRQVYFPSRDTTIKSCLFVAHYRKACGFMVERLVFFVRFV